MKFVDTYNSAGWLRMPAAFPPALIDELRAEYLRQRAALELDDDITREHLRVGDERVMLTVKLTGPFLSPALYANPSIIGVLSFLLGKNMLIDNFTCTTALPGADEQRVHFDHSDLFSEKDELRAALPPYAITVAVPLVDLTPETGTTRLFPGSHTGPMTDAFELPYLNRGDGFLMDYRMWHNGTANRTDGERPVLYIIYSRPWFTDYRNFDRQPRIRMDESDFISIPREHRPLFRRLAAKGAFDRTEKELLER